MEVGEEGVVVQGEGHNVDVTITEVPVPVVQKKVYDLMDDLLEEVDVLKLYRQVLTEEDTQVKVGGKVQFGYLSRMTLGIIGVMNAQSFCERTLSCEVCNSLIVTDLHTSLSREETK